MRQAENKVFIEGILSEINLKEGSYSKNGVPTEYIGGNITVRVSQKIGDKIEDLEIPVQMFAPKLKKDGNINPAYSSALDILENYVSIAACGNEDEADRIRISRGELTQNEYADLNKNIVSYTRVRASFVNKIKKADFKPKATFNVEMYVAKKFDEIDKDGIETGRYVVKGVIPQFGGRVDVMTFIVESKSAIEAIRQFWGENETFKATGKLNFSSKTEIVKESIGFGEPIEKQKTTNVSELIITGGSESPLEGEMAFNPEEIRAALVERNQRLEMEKTKERKPAVQAAPKFDSSDFGF